MDAATLVLTVELLAGAETNFPFFGGPRRRHGPPQVVPGAIAVLGNSLVNIFGLKDVISA